MVVSDPDRPHPSVAGMAVWPGHPVFPLRVVSWLEDGNIARDHVLEMSEYSGTHFDAPVHFIADGAKIDSTPFGAVAEVPCGTCYCHSLVSAAGIADI